MIGGTRWPAPSWLAALVGPSRGRIRRGERQDALSTSYPNHITRRGRVLASHLGHPRASAEPKAPVAADRRIAETGRQDGSGRRLIPSASRCRRSPQSRPTRRSVGSETGRLRPVALMGQRSVCHEKLLATAGHPPPMRSSPGWPVSPINSRRMWELRKHRPETLRKSGQLAEDVLPDSNRRCSPTARKSVR